MHYPELLAIILERYTLPLDGVHGVAHWARVFENGETLAEHTGARLPVVQLFALFHDSCRRNEMWDPRHGLRAAEFARSLLDGPLALSASDFDLLYRACAGHTRGHTEEDVTVQTCWDADRLDLGRAGIMPRTDRLCTEAARRQTVMDWAYRRSIQGCFPPQVLRAWDLPEGEYRLCDPGQGSTPLF